MWTSQPSLFRRMMLGFTCFLLALALFGFLDRLHYAKVNQFQNTASENKTRTRQAILMLALAADQPHKLVATAASIEAIRRDLFRDMGYQSRVRMRIWHHGRLIFNSAPALPERLPQVAGPGNAWVRWIERDARAGLVVECMHEVDDEWLLSWGGVRFLVVPTVFHFVLLLIPAWIIVTVGLRPLRRIAHAIIKRADGDLRPLPDTQYRELSPVVQAINELMARLGAQIEREREMLVDAAHELKTPLAAIQLNGHLVLSRAETGNLEGSREAGAGLREGILRATHAVDQLLVMERLGADTPGAAGAPLDLKTFLRERLAAAAPLAFQRDIEIELHASAPVTVVAQRESLALLVDNLVGNAIKYSPPQGRIDVTLAQLDQSVRLTITDQGPGIAPALRAKAFERFYRVPGQDQLGSGLGLAIAQRAAVHNRATIALADGADGKGLSVVVEFTTAPPAKSN